MEQRLSPFESLKSVKVLLIQKVEDEQRVQITL